MTVTAPTPDDDSGTRLRRAVTAVARNLGWVVAGSGARGILSLFYLAICARTLGLEGFGRFALITTASQAIVLMVGFQTWQIVVQYGVHHVARGDAPALARLYRVCGLLEIASAAIGIVLGATILYVWGQSMGIRPGLMRDTMIFLVVQLITVRSMPTGILRLRDKFAVATYADSIVPVVRLVGALFVAAVVPTVKGFLYAWMVAELVTAIAFWVIIARTEDLGAARRARAPYRVIAAENPKLLRFALSINGNATLSLASKQVPLLLVGGTVGTQAAGAFRLAAQLAQALAKLSQLFTRAAFPEVVRAVRDASAATITRMLVRTALVSTGAALLVALVVTVAGEPMLGLIGGPDFRGAFPALLWLTVAGCLELAAVGFEPVLIALHRSGTALVIRACAAVVVVAAAVLLIARYGATGAAVAVCVGALVAAVMQTLITFAVARRERPAV